MKNKIDNDKIRLDYLDPFFIEGMGTVLTQAGEKYSPYSWQKVINPVDRYYAALFRHMLAHRRGSTVDEESNLSHMWHIGSNAMFIDWFDRNPHKIQLESALSVRDIEIQRLQQRNFTNFPHI